MAESNISHTSFENVIKCKYLEMTVTNKNYVLKAESQLNFGNIYYHAV
jgi:hypothetical protein